MQAVILAAGKGTRLHPITADRCKALAPIAGVPIIGRLVERIVENGVRDFVVVLRDGEHELQEYLEARFSEDLSFRYVVQKERLGMAHALGLAAPQIDGDFLLAACDNLVAASHFRTLLDAFEGPANAVLTLMEVDESEVTSLGIVEWRDERVESIVEKPALSEAASNIASLPIYVFSSKLLEYLPEIEPSSRGEYELQDAIQSVIDRDGEVTGVFTETRDDLTTTDDCLLLNALYLRRELDGHCEAPEDLPASVRLIPPVRIDRGVKVGADSVVGPDVYLERGSEVGAGSRIENAVILRKSRISPGSHVEGRVVLDLN
jgi:glucose-1-phosphate thymidylyltransferase